MLRDGYDGASLLCGGGGTPVGLVRSYYVRTIGRCRLPGRNGPALQHQQDRAFSCGAARPASCLSTSVRARAHACGRVRTARQPLPAGVPCTSTVLYMALLCSARAFNPPSMLRGLVRAPTGKRWREPDSTVHYSRLMGLLDEAAVTRKTKLPLTFQWKTR